MTGEPLPDKSWFRPDEVATLLGISRATVYRRIEDGTILALQIGDLYRISRASLIDLLSFPPK